MMKPAPQSKPAAAPVGAHRRPTDEAPRTHPATHYFTDVDRACRAWLRARGVPMNGWEDNRLNVRSAR